MLLQSSHETLCKYFEWFWCGFGIVVNVLLVSIDGVKSQYRPELCLKLLNPFVTTGERRKNCLNPEALGIVCDVLVDICCTFPVSTVRFNLVIKPCNGTIGIASDDLLEVRT